MALYSSPTTTNSLQKSPAFSLNGFRRRNHLRIQPCSSSSSTVVNFSSGSSLGGFYSLQRNNLGFSIGAANVNGGVGGGGGGETEKKKKEVVVDDNELADVPVAAKVIGVVTDVHVAAKVIGVVAGSVSMNVALVTISHHIDALVSAIYFDHLVASMTPAPDLTVITMLTSVVVAIAEVTVQGSAVSQPYLLTLAGIVGYAAMKSIIPQPLCWVFLVGFVCYSRFVKRKDYVSSAFPSAAVMTVVGGPWVRLLVIGSYAALAIYQRTKKRLEAESDVSNSILLPAALAIGFTLIHELLYAAKCFRFST